MLLYVVFLRRSKTISPAGTHVLGVVITVYTLKKIRTLGKGIIYQKLVQSGYADSEIKDGSAAIIRGQCCGDPDEHTNNKPVYAAPEIGLDIGDIVEVRMSCPKILPVVVSVRQKHDAGTSTCKWMPDNEKLWTRTMYSKGIENDGWEQYGLYNWWMKKPDSGDKIKSHLEVLQ